MSWNLNLNWIASPLLQDIGNQTESFVKKLLTPRGSESPPTPSVPETKTKDNLSPRKKSTSASPKSARNCKTPRTSKSVPPTSTGDNGVRRGTSSKSLSEGGTPITERTPDTIKDRVPSGIISPLPKPIVPKVPNPNAEPGFLLIRIRNAKNLPVGPVQRQPYALVTVGNVTVSTRQCKKMEEATWDDLFDFIIEDRNSEKVQIMLLGKETDPDREVPLAETEFLFSELLHFEMVEKELDLRDLEHKDSIFGKMRVLFRFLSLSNPRKDLYLDRYGFPVPSQEVYEISLQTDTNYNDTSFLISSLGTKKVARMGIAFPYKVRHWQILMMRHLGLTKTPFTSGLYKKLLQEPGNPLVLKMIDKDIPRTFPNHPIFMSPEGKAALGRILKAFSLKHPQIGYTQAMNFIAGYLLLLMEEELAFKVLTVIVEYLIPGYYMISMAGLQADQLVLTHLVREKLPALYEHLPKIDVDLNVVTTKWFLCLFIHTLPFPSVLRVWDVFFSNGATALILAAVAILKIKEEEILSISHSLKTSGDFLDEITQTFYNSEQLIQEMYSIASFSSVKKMQEEANEKIRLKIMRTTIRDLATITQFTEEELIVFEKEFSSMATNGSVNKAEFTCLFDKKFSKFIDDPVIKDQVFIEFDKNGDGTLDFRDYILSLSTLCKGPPKEKIKTILNVFDTDKDGYINKVELMGLLRWQFRVMGFPNQEDMLLTSAEIALLEHDLDKDGKLSLDEFFVVCHKQPVVVHMFDLVGL